MIAYLHSINVNIDKFNIKTIYFIMKQFDSQIEYWAHMLDEAFYKNVNEDDKQPANVTLNSISAFNDKGDDDDKAEQVVRALADDTLEEFVADLNKLATDEKLANLRDAFVEKFNASKLGDKDNTSFEVKWGEENLDIKSILPTQSEVSMEKSLAYPLNKNPEGIPACFKNPVVIAGKPIVVANVNDKYYIIDGHHRWSQVYCLNPEAKMTAEVITSSAIKNPDDILKLVQAQIFVSTDGRKLPSNKVGKDTNLYGIDEKSFKAWCWHNMKVEAARILAKIFFKSQQNKQKEVSETKKGDNDTKRRIISKLWSNVMIMNKQAKPMGGKQKAHGRPVMPQTDGDGVPKDGYKQDTALKISNTIAESERRHMKKYTKKQILEALKYWKKRLDILNESVDMNDFDSDEVVDEVFNTLSDDRELLQLAKDYRGDMEDAAEEAVDSGLSFDDAVDAVYDKLIDIAESIGKPVENGEPASQELDKIKHVHENEDEVLTEGLLSWLGDLFTSKEEKKFDKAIKAMKARKEAQLQLSQKANDLLKTAKKHAAEAADEPKWSIAGSKAQRAADYVNDAWEISDDFDVRDSVAEVALALAFKLKYAKASWYSVCRDFCSQLNKQLQYRIKRMTSDELVKKCVSGWTGPEYTSSEKKSIPGNGWIYEPAYGDSKGGWVYDNGY